MAHDDVDESGGRRVDRGHDGRDDDAQRPHAPRRDSHPLRQLAKIGRVGPLKVRLDGVAQRRPRSAADMFERMELEKNKELNHIHSIGLE